MLEKIKSTHSEDSTVIYIPDEKVVFLGDCAYGTTTNSLFHFKQSLLLPMIKDIQKYDAEMFLLGHESICDSDEMNIYWKELSAASQVVKSTSLENALECFKLEFYINILEKTMDSLQAFVNDHVIHSQ